MVLQIVTFPIKPGRKSAFQKALMTAVEATRNETGVNLYLPGWEIEDENTCILIEEYRDQAALDSHLAEEHTKTFLAELDQYLSARPELRVYQVGSLDVQQI
jgi:quinol monooxygenase YgiN